MEDIADMWLSGQPAFSKWNIEQWLSAAGGRLTNGSEASTQFRRFLQVISFDSLDAFIHQCLVSKHIQRGLILQDLMNAVGSKLGFVVRQGLYRGTSEEPGYDGIWKAPTDGFSLIVEIKRSGAYTVPLRIAADYRERLVARGDLDNANSSILYVIGDESPIELEDQIRGSEYARTTRVVSIEALLRLLKIRRDMEEDADLEKVFKLFRPIEYIRIDSIVDLVFAASAREVLDGEDGAEIEPTADHDLKWLCVQNVQKRLKTPLIEQSASRYKGSQSSIKLIMYVARRPYKGNPETYWFGLRPTPLIFLKENNAYIALACGTADQILLMPGVEILNRLERLLVDKDGRYLWTVEKRDGEFHLVKRAGEKEDVTRFLHFQLT